MKKSGLIIFIVLGVIVIALIISIFMSNNISENTYNLQAAAIHAVKYSTSLGVDMFINRLKEPNMTIIDIRTPQEYSSGHIDGAINIDFYAPDFAQQLEKLDKVAGYSIYCRSGSRSGKALDIMKNLGFTNVVDLQGGYSSLLK